MNIDGPKRVSNYEKSRSDEAMLWVALELSTQVLEEDEIKSNA